MSLIQTTIVNNACLFVHIPEINFKLLCSAPEDVVKHLRRLGIIKPISENGVHFEDGPNAILLSDTSMQNGCLSNLSEFPVLHMLYVQGMIIPNHPNNNGKKPLILGSTKQTTSHLEYIYLGNYGITDEAHMLDIGLSKEDVKKYMSMKKAFAFGKFKDSHELLSFINIEKDEKQIEENLTLKREGRNLFTLKYKNESVLIDMNLKKDETYYAPYNLGFYDTKLEHFAVAHIGNGDGWNIDEPSMSSVLFSNGRIYLIDAGPNIFYLLDRLSISINQVDGIFITHIHDDHFCGLLSLMESDRKITIYAISIIRESIIAKLSNTLSVPRNMISNFVDFVDLKLDDYNNIFSLEVKPIISPHPIETTIFYFRKMTKDGYKTYGHLADLASFDVLDNLSKPHENDEDKTIFNFYQNSKKNYLIPTDLKKIDAGGGMIHGKVTDFKDDKSKKILIAHKSKKATLKEISIASETFFGSIDILDASYVHYDINNVYVILNNYLSGYSLSASKNGIDSIANNEIIIFNPGNIIAKEGDKVENVYLTLKGNAFSVESDESIRTISSGSFLRKYNLFYKKIGETYQYRLGFTELTDSSTYSKTYIAKSFVNTLKIPKHIFNRFIISSLFEYEKVENISFKKFIYQSSIFGNAISSKIINKIVENMKIHYFDKDDTLHDKLSEHSIFFIYEGNVHTKFCSNKPNVLQNGDFFGAEYSIFSFLNIETITAISKKVILFEIEAKVLINSPIIYRKMLENYINHQEYIYDFVSYSIPLDNEKTTLPQDIDMKYKTIMEKILIFEYMFERFEDQKLIENFICNLLQYLKIYSNEVELILIKNINLRQVFKFVRKDIKNIIKILSDDLDKLNQNLIIYENIEIIIKTIKTLMYEHKNVLQDKLLGVKNEK
jgi:hemerythrin